jgi:glycosyltransferase involved in cell wall biosynthesis
MPFDDGPPRLLRSAILARELASRGHHVTYWNASFDHQTKTMRDPKWDGLMNQDDYRTRLLAGRTYSKNISVARILSQRENAADFRRLAKTEPLPNVIVCGFPTIELAYAGTRFAKQYNIPAIVDCRDMWPDIFEQQITGLKRLLAQPVLTHWHIQKHQVMKSARSIVGITDPFVDWGLLAAGRGRTAFDRAFHLAVQTNTTPLPQLVAAKKLWAQQIGQKTKDIVRICFAGTLSSRIALRQILAVLKQHRFERLQFVMCGRGDLEEELAVHAQSHPNLVMAGWRSQAEISGLLSTSDIGLLPYSNNQDFLSSYPNKVGEYLSAGLPILTGLGGITGGLLRDNRIGFFYDNDNAVSIFKILNDLDKNLKPDASRTARARKVFNEYFDPNEIYPAYADHVETIARSALMRENHDPIT